MSTAKNLKAALLYLESECYRAGFPETGYLIEVARLSLDAPRRAEAPALPGQGGMVRLRARWRWRKSARHSLMTGI